MLIVLTHFTLSDVGSNIKQSLIMAVSGGLCSGLQSNSYSSESYIVGGYLDGFARQFEQLLDRRKLDNIKTSSVNHVAYAQKPRTSERLSKQTETGI